MYTISSKDTQSFQTKILTWYDAHQRDLPWRKSRDPYRILISEVMLQQTQVSRVIPKYEAWLERFPTIESLADAPVSDVLWYWSGLGYNRRALYLKKCAETLIHEYANVWPRVVKELMTLPGIGEYTARALLCFAFDEQVAVVDTNVRKVILLELLRDKTEPSVKEMQEIAERLLPNGKAYEWNQALMDYAASELQHLKISIPKQSRFKDSDRYYRGQTIKLLLQHHTLPVEALVKLLVIENDRYELILTRLVKDGMVKRNRGNVSLT